MGNSLFLDTYILMHWNGTMWPLVGAPAAKGSILRSLKAFGSDDVWAVGSKGAGGNCFCSTTFTLHWNGTAWSEVPSPNADVGNYLSGVDGASPNDV